MVVTIVTDQTGTVVEEFIGGEHVHTTGFNILFGGITVDIEIIDLEFVITRPTQVITHCAVEIRLAFTVEQTVVIDIEG